MKAVEKAVFQYRDIFKFATDTSMNIISIKHRKLGYFGPFFPCSTNVFIIKTYYISFFNAKIEF